MGSVPSQKTNGTTPAFASLRLGKRRLSSHAAIATTLFPFFVDTELSYDAGLDAQSALDSGSSVELATSDRTPGRAAIVFLLLALGALWFVACRYLSDEWSFNEQYNYGWFVPFFAAYLFWLRWEDRPAALAIANRGLRILAIALIAGAALILLPLRIFEIGSADWRPLGWVHVAAVATITLSIIYLAGGTPWLRHFSFPVLFFFVAVPWPSPIEEPIVQGLMRVVAASAAEVLALFGIPAEVQGNLILLPHGLVGVNEACSGVRSLQTSLTIGLLFGELKRLRLGPRLILIASAIAIALFANFLRATFLVWIASADGLAALSRWHDLAGYAIVVLVFIGTMWIASRWKTHGLPESRKSVVGRQKSEGRHQRSDVREWRSALGFYFSVALLAWVIVAEIGAEFWYRIHERDLVARPGWSVRWPKNEPGYRVLKIDSEVRNILRFDSGREVAWTPRENGAAAVAAHSAVDYLFFFRWNPGSGTILRARAHRPDICLPAAGWREVGKDRIESYLVGPNRSLPFRRFDFVKPNRGGPPLHAVAFFTLHEDVVHKTEMGAAAAAGLYSNWDWADRWRVVRNGIRNRGQQVFELIMLMPPDADDSTADQQFAKLLPNLIETK
jgi:exosortase